MYIFYVVYKTNSPWLEFSAISSILSSTLSYSVLYYHRRIVLQVHSTYWKNENYNRIHDTTHVIHIVFIESLRYVINIFKHKNLRICLSLDLSGSSYQNEIISPYISDIDNT